MSEPSAVSASPAGTATAGQLLRAARQSQGLHIAALASAIKVTPKKLELLEADRFDELPDATFTRALAQTVCRSLKIEAAPVLALLPPSRSQGFEKAGGGLNARYREVPSRMETGDGAGWGKLAVWAPVVILGAAAAVYFLPASLLPFGLGRQQSVADREPAARPGALFPPTMSGASPAGEPDRAQSLAGVPSVVDAAVATGAAASGSPTNSLGTPAESAPAATNAVAVSAAQAAGEATPMTTTAAVDAPKLLRLRAVADSWIQVTDATGQALLGRVVRAGETIELDGAVPLKLRIGNAAATEVTFRGEPQPLAPVARNNLVSLELK